MDLVDSKELQGMATKQNEAAKELLGSLSLLM